MKHFSSKSGGSHGESLPNQPSSSKVDNPFCSKLEQNSNVQSCANVLLGTAIVQVQDKFGSWHSIRCLLDSGSQTSIISLRLAQLLKLPWKSSSVHISGIDSDLPVKAKGELVCHILPHQKMLKSKTKPINVQAVILTKIANNLSTNVSNVVLEQFSHLTLADQSYLNSNLDSTIDLLIGAEHYCNLMDPSISMLVGNPSAVPTKLGWLLLGKTPSIVPSTSNVCKTFFVTEDPLSAQLQKFWETEELPQYEHKDPEALACENHFVKTHERDSLGRYVLKLPFKDLDSINLGSNREIALKRLHSLDKKLSKDPEYKKMYDENLKSYLEPGHMNVAKKSVDYLLIHFGIYKETSSTTKLRCVYDPNIESDIGNSLAKCLMVGPKLQKDIADLLTVFRLNPVAIICDIQAMYRSIWIHPDDRKYQHILWHEDSSHMVREFELCTVTFGLPPSPFQAQRVLQQLALDEGKDFPRGAEVLNN